MTMSRAIEFLEAHQSPTPSRWREDAQWRRDNEMGCTQQYVSNLLKGSSNMTLETIARLENALGIDLVKSAVPSRPQYLSDSAGEKLDPNIKTSDFVEGYKHRKK